MRTLVYNGSVYEEASLEEVFFCINYPRKMTVEDAISSGKELVKASGYQVGSHDIEQEEPGLVCLNIQVGKNFCIMLEKKGGWEKKKNGVSINAEAP